MNYLAILVLGLSVSGDTRSPAKTVESKMVEISESLYASKFEASNFEYKDFLKDLQTKGVDISEFQVVQENWLGIDKADPLEIYYRSRPAFDNYPVVNVPFEGAVEFCGWLTEKYNGDKKRKFNQVKFRLPTKDEWIAAASGGNEKAIFPWGTSSLRSENGTYKCNYWQIDEALLKVDLEDRNVIEIDPSNRKNNFAYTAPVDSFDPGVNGIYNMSGNVAEMLQEKGHTKGGSWGSSGYYVRIDAEDEFQGVESSPYVGFRVFMEVISE